MLWEGKGLPTPSPALLLVSHTAGDLEDDFFFYAVVLWFGFGWFFFKFAGLISRRLAKPRSDVGLPGSTPLEMLPGCLSCQDSDGSSRRNDFIRGRPTAAPWGSTGGRRAVAGPSAIPRRGSSAYRGNQKTQKSDIGRAVGPGLHTTPFSLTLFVKRELYPAPSRSPRGIKPL